MGRTHSAGIEASRVLRTHFIGMSVDGTRIPELSSTGVR
jgi:hypothetical protein